MRCAWEELLAVLPPHMRGEIDRIGKRDLQELRLRVNVPPELILPKESHWLEGERIREADLQYILNGASRFSPWAAASVARGYITISGGHRIGICGEMVWQNGQAVGIRKVWSMCIRVARDHTGLLSQVPPQNQSILILGAPGWGKTTLLRDLIRWISRKNAVAVIDERGELFPKDFERGPRTDVLTGCRKKEGMEMALRTMAPAYLAVDEITEAEDTQALLHCANCGVKLLATAHAASRSEFYSRACYRPLVEQRVIGTLLILNEKKQYVMERMESCTKNTWAQY